MTRKRSSPLVRAVTNRLWQRDRFQMRIVGAILSAVEHRRKLVARRVKERFAFRSVVPRRERLGDR